MLGSYVSKKILNAGSAQKEKMKSKTRVREALNHRQPDRVPVDFGGTAVTGMHVLPPKPRNFPNESSNLPSINSATSAAK